MDKDIICWWSGGITSAVACKVAIDLYGLNRCRVVMIDTKNEHPDTYRFLMDCERWYGLSIESITGIGEKYNSIQDVWIKNKSLNVSHGAVCSSELKRRVREKWQKENNYTHQVFGFEFDKKEFNRAMSMTLNHPKAKPIFPLLMMGYDKGKCIDIVKEAGIDVPEMYLIGFNNNNCFKTGCVQGGIGYWQKMKREFPEKFNAMAEMEHKLTDMKGAPVTMLKDQSKNGGLLFLKPHKDYPEVKDISIKKGVEPEPLMDCNGFCSLNDLNEHNKNINELNFGQVELLL